MSRIAIYSNEIPTDANPMDDAKNDYDRYTRLLSKHMPDTEFVMFDVTKQQFPVNIAQFSGAIFGGSGAMVGDDRDWFGPLRQHIKTLHEAHLKIWGTCFGHQMIASVFGAQIGVREPTIGAPQVEILSPQQWMHPYMPSVRILAGNLQQVLKLGPGMRRIAMARGNANAMYAIGDNIVGFQFHPELTPKFMHYYADQALHNGVIDIHRHHDAKSEFSEAIDADIVAKWMARFFLS